jgi:hypothetical protein
MSNALDLFIAQHKAPKSAIVVAGDYPCTDMVHTDEWGWNVCGTRKTQMWGGCPNAANHGRPVVAPKELDDIEPGDRIKFYHPASNQDQFATVLEWTVGRRFPDGKPAEWDAVVHIEHLGLGNGFGGRARVQRHSFQRYQAAGIKHAYTPGVYL